jgi:hypothetical protein
MPGLQVSMWHWDKLVQVRLRNGQDELILIHLEVQHWPERGFPARLYSYHRRLEEKGSAVVTVVILADTDPEWRPSHYEQERLGCRVAFDFPICKLLDLVERREELERSQNPAALVVLANWAAQQTSGDSQERRRWKLRLMRSTYEKGFGREDILELYRFLDWVMELPPELEREFRNDILRNEEKLMPYVTSFERLAREEGWQEGRQEGRQEVVKTTREMIKEAVLVRFGDSALALMAPLDAEEDLAKLKAIHRLALTSQDLDDFRRRLEREEAL